MKDNFNSCVNNGNIFNMDKVNMDKIEWIFFDCMETLVDMKELPAFKDYAAWAYYGSGAEMFFGSFEYFLELYGRAKNEIAAELGNEREYNLSRRFEMTVQWASAGNPVLSGQYGTGDSSQAVAKPDSLQVMKSMDSHQADINMDSHQAPVKLDSPQTVIRLLEDNYWKNYSERCFIREDVAEMLPRLKQKYNLGVVSNFMVDGGIEELLEYNGIIEHFKFVVTSIREGWRKPNARIYDAALKLAAASADKVLFIGDDYMNDYIGPAEYGMSSLLLDRNGKYEKTENRISSFYELGRLLL